MRKTVLGERAKLSRISVISWKHLQVYPSRWMSSSKKESCSIRDHRSVKLYHTGSPFGPLSGGQWSKPHTSKKGAMKYEQDTYGNIQLLILSSYSRQLVNGLCFVAREFLAFLFGIIMYLLLIYKKISIFNKIKIKCNLIAWISTLFIDIVWLMFHIHIHIS